MVIPYQVTLIPYGIQCLPTPRENLPFVSYAHLHICDRGIFKFYAGVTTIVPLFKYTERLKRLQDREKNIEDVLSLLTRNDVLM